MPKVGMEPVRRKALIDATIAEIGAAGTLDVTVGKIARRAGMSSGLAHHYFGSKEQIFLAAMRHILREYGDEVRRALGQARSPRERISAIIHASFEPGNFTPETVAAWLNFYVYAQTVSEAQRLLSIYARRLHSNLVHALSQLTDPVTADEIALAVAALIDGFYIRQALKAAPVTGPTISAIVENAIDRALERP